MRFSCIISRAEAPRRNLWYKRFNTNTRIIIPKNYTVGSINTTCIVGFHWETCGVRDGMQATAAWDIISSCMTTVDIVIRVGVASFGILSLYQAWSWHHEYFEVSLPSTRIALAIYLWCTSLVCRSNWATTERMIGTLFWRYLNLYEELAQSHRIAI